MYGRHVRFALCTSIGVVAISHVQVFRKAINALCVFVPCMHQGVAAITWCTNQTIDMTLKHTGVNLISHHDRSNVYQEASAVNEQWKYMENSHYLVLINWTSEAREVDGGQQEGRVVISKAGGRLEQRHVFRCDFDLRLIRREHRSNGLFKQSRPEVLHVQRSYRK